MKMKGLGNKVLGFSRWRHLNIKSSLEAYALCVHNVNFNGKCSLCNTVYVTKIQVDRLECVVTLNYGFSLSSCFIH